MKTHIKVTNTSLTPAIEEYIYKKMEMLDKLIHKDDTSAHVAVEVGKNSEHHKAGEIFFSELNMHIAGKDLRVRFDADDIYAAIDKAKDEMMHALRAHRGKRETLLRRGGSAIKNMLKGFKPKR